MSVQHCIKVSATVLTKAGSESEYQTAPSTEPVKGRGRGSSPRPSPECGESCCCPVRRNAPSDPRSDFSLRPRLYSGSYSLENEIHPSDRCVFRFYFPREDCDAPNQISVFKRHFLGFDPHSTQTSQLPIPNANHLRYLVKDILTHGVSFADSSFRRIAFFLPADLVLTSPASSYYRLT
jgi:hypothetical protein